MPEQPELKPCPFCGCDSVGARHDGPYLSVICGRCAARGPRVVGNVAAANQKWNSRSFAGKEEAEMVYTRLQSIAFKHNKPNLLTVLTEFDVWLGYRVLKEQINNLRMYWKETPLEIAEDFKNFLIERNKDNEEVCKKVEEISGRTENKD